MLAQERQPDWSCIDDSPRVISVVSGGSEAFSGEEPRKMASKQGVKYTASCLKAKNVGSSSHHRVAEIS